MQTIKQSMYFTYDGISCRDFKLVNVNLDSGMFTERLVADREIIETKVRGNDAPLFHGIEDVPLEFELILAFEGNYTDNDIDNVILWLFKDNYKPLIFEGDLNRVYHCIPVGSSEITHTGFREGYVKITMRNKSSKVVSPMIETQLYDFSSNANGQNIIINNIGHESVYPEISIEKIGSGIITITKDSKIFEIRNLTNLEKIYVNCEKEIIETDLIGVYRYEDVVGEYHNILLKRGSNTINVKGNCKIKIRFVAKYKF